MKRVARGAGNEPKRRRCEQPTVDRLSALPDSLLLHTLSFLRMKDVVLTALLSRRWRHLWTSTPCLDFSGRGAQCRELGAEGYVSPDFVDRVLILHDSAKVNIFCAAVGQPKKWKQYWISELVERMDSWVRFALRRGVEELELDCRVVADDFDGFMEYTLPHCLFTSESLVSLTLRSCWLDPPTGFLMSSLKTLTLCSMDIREHNLEDMLCGCPFLEYLTLQDCNEGCDLDVYLETANSRLKTLRICEVEGVDVYGSGVTLSAPGITTVVFEGYLRINYNLVDMSSIVTARIDFSAMFYITASSFDVKCLLHLLCELHHIQGLSLCSWCIQVLSVRASEHSTLSLDFSIKSLELALGFVTYEFPGIFYALRSFTKLEFLTIDIMREEKRVELLDDVLPKYRCADEAKYVMLDKSSSPGMLQHLRTVNILGLVRKIDAEEESKSVEEILEKYQSGFEFIQFLLMNSPVLERLAISTPGDANKLTQKTLKILFTFTSRLLALPRASPNALVIIKDM